MCENDLGKILTTPQVASRGTQTGALDLENYCFFFGDRSSFLRNRFVHIHTHTFFEGKVNLGPRGKKELKSCDEIISCYSPWSCVHVPLNLWKFRSNEPILFIHIMFFFKDCRQFVGILQEDNIHMCCFSAGISDNLWEFFKKIVLIKGRSREIFCIRYFTH